MRTGNKATCGRSWRTFLKQSLVWGHRWLHRFIGLGIVLSAIVAGNEFRSEAQGPFRWAPQARIPSYQDSTEEPPFLVADQNHTVHAFNSQPLELDIEGSPRAVFYRQWTLEDGWTEPTDIILNAAGNELDLMSVYYDRGGMVHLAIQMNNEEIYYTRAPLANAGQAPAWLVPLYVGGEAVNATAGLPYVAAIAGDDNGNLVIIYGGWRDGNGIYAAHSTDGGDTWSEPVPIFLTYDKSVVSAEPKLSVGRSGQMHAVWASFNQDGTGVSGHYARFDIARRQWSDAVEIDEGGLGLGIRFANLIEYGDDLILTYYNGNANANWWRRSGDGGQTWTQPVRISTRHVGTNGPVSFVVDSSNVLHLFFGQRTNDNIHGMWHTIWIGSGWTEPSAVVQGPQVRDRIGGRGFDPRSARAAISNGNVLLVTWGTDGAAGENGAWYSYTALDTPELPAIPLPIPSVTPTTVPMATATPSWLTSTPAPTKPILTMNQSDRRDGAPINPATPIVISMALVGLLIAGSVAVHRYATMARRR